MEQFLIVCPLVFLAGFVDSIAGGGGLISFPAYMLAGVPVHVILGTSKLSAFPGSIVAALRFAKSGYIRFKLALPWAASAALGAVGGASLALKTDEKLIRSLMVVVLPVVAFYVLKNKELGGGEAPDRSEDPDGFRRMFFTGLAVSFLIGGYDGFYGPGTGTFLILVFTGLLKLGTRDAAGISKVVNLSADIGALGTFFVGGKGGLCPGDRSGPFLHGRQLLWSGARGQQRAEDRKACGHGRAGSAVCEDPGGVTAVPCPGGRPFALLYSGTICDMISCDFLAVLKRSCSETGGKKYEVEKIYAEDHHRGGGLYQQSV